MNIKEPKNIRPWNTQDPGLHAIFCAAITGWVANIGNGTNYTNSAEKAVEFADKVVLASLGEVIK